MKNQSMEPQSGWIKYQSVGFRLRHSFEFKIFSVSCSLAFLKHFFVLYFFYFLSALCSFFNVRQSLFIARKKLSWQIRRSINIISLQGDYYWTTERAARLHIVLHTPQSPHRHIPFTDRDRNSMLFVCELKQIMYSNKTKRI